MPEEKLASRWLVSTDWLAPASGRSECRSCSTARIICANHKRDAEAEFLAGHIPGAQRFDIDAISDKSNPLPHMLPSAEQFAAQVGALGVGDGMTVVLYDGIGLYGAARVWWTFRIFGSENVRVLDGGMPKWKAEGRPLETGPAKPRAPKTFTPKFNRAMVASIDDVQKVLLDKTAQVVDARAADRFRGEAPEPRAGLARRPYAGLVQRAVRPGAARTAGSRRPTRSRPPSSRPASISTSRSSQVAARASPPRS